MKKYEYAIIIFAVIGLVFLPIWLGLIVLAGCFGAAFWIRAAKKRAAKSAAKRG